MPQRAERTPTYGARLASAAVAAGVLAGLAGAALTVILHAVQHVAFGGPGGALLAGVAAAPAWRRVAAPVVGAFVAGLGWWWLRRSPLPGVAARMTPGSGRMPLGRTTVDALLQIVVVGSGAPIGREKAPRQVAAALADLLGDRARLDEPARRVLVAAAAGAGLAAVYNVPVAGAVFAVEVLGVRRLRDIALCLVVSAAATVTAWPVIGTDPTYDLPALPGAGIDVWLWGLAAAPFALAVGVPFREVSSWAQEHAPRPTWRLPLLLALGAAVVGAASWWWPQLPGNGTDIVQAALEARDPLATFAILLVLKPLATGVSLGSGASGGTLTPALATGASLGAVVALALTATGRPLPTAAYALVGAAAVLAVTLRAPWFAAVFAWELARPAPSFFGPILLATLLSGACSGALRRRRCGPPATP